MTKALSKRAVAIRQTSREIARTGCPAVAALKRAGGSDQVAILDQLQVYLRHCLIEVEEQQRDWEARTNSRQEWVKRYRRRYGPSAAIGDHRRAVRAIRDLLSEQRQLIRQLGDGIAWTLLREDPRTIYPLFAARSHHLPAGQGLVGQAQVAIDIHKGGELLAIDNDLTRCLGTGDLTVVSADGQWGMPLCVECKTALPGGELTMGAEIVVSMTTVVSTDESHALLQRRFEHAVGATLGHGGRIPREGDAAQAEQMKAQAEDLLASIARRPMQLQGTAARWRDVRAVLSRAHQIGAAYDVPEPSLAYVAVRNLPEDDAIEAYMSLLPRLQADGFPAGEAMLSSADLASTDRMSAVIPPIAIWPLPLHQRIALLSTDVLLACVFRRDVWKEAFSAAGLELVQESGCWTLQDQSSRSAMFDPLERMRLELGVAFAGFSPQAVAFAVAKFLDTAPGSG